MAHHIHWQPGALLTANHFVQQDSLAQKAISEATYLPFNVGYGISQLQLDMNLLSLGELKINQCQLYFKDKYFAYFDCYSHNVSIDLEALGKPAVTIYLNRVEKVIKEGQVETCQSDYYLSDEYQSSALHSLHIMTVENTEGVWQIGTESPPLLSCASQTLDRCFSQVKKVFSSVKHFLDSEIVGESVMVNLLLAHRNLQLLIAEIESAPLHVHPYRLFEALSQLYTLLDLTKAPSQGNEALLFYRHQDPITGFDQLLHCFNQLLSIPVKKNFVELMQTADSFILTALPMEAVQANEHLLVIQKKDPEQPHLALSQIKLSSISRNQHINQMSLSGAYLEALPDSGVHQLSHIKDAKVYKILPGFELDAILREKNMMFEANEVNSQYRYLIYYR
ncbi:type VI secretion system baseplate subunit TssK [Vibrio marisflavi]|uniref:Type VI secretion system baseplate subunit TssK n=1 Tax=Vibrio marisflavi CECT 7928 TaxID=634439 RepID=A0ABN8E6K0_9VIBR|nr:type VI secretion system baseplate subunit TssK [Vibrio marisflavi]CAH0538634.1 hypothetical protein VMF7928_01558 [Vibrio marisflavi CECT 7928]